jgi:FkbM family methyltransferase
MRFREFTEDEREIASVYLGNEYRLPDAFGKEDAVVDVGAHIGCFALACLKRGAGRLWCFEPYPPNYSLLRENMRGYEATVVQAAVWRSDREERVSMYAPPDERLTARAQIRADVKGVGGHCVGLDGILRELGHVRFLKLDCEGSEWPILYTCTELGRVDEIAMEVHQTLPHPGWEALCSSEALAAWLGGKGFRVEVKPQPECPDINHLLFAKRGA